MTSQKNPLVYWDDMGFRYASAFVAADLPIRILSTGGLVDHTDEQSRWYTLISSFGVPLAPKYVNVVCSDNGDVHRFFTVGVPNVAITGVLPRAPNDVELRTLRYYNLILCPTHEDVDAFRSIGLRASYFPPEPDSLSNMKTMLEAFP